MTKLVKLARPMTLAEVRAASAAGASLRNDADPGWRCNNCFYMSGREDGRTCDAAADRRIVTELPPDWCPLRYALTIDDPLKGTP